MTALKHRMIGAGLLGLRFSGLHRIAAPWTRGAGAILTFHRVTAEPDESFAPNRLLSVTPDFLDAVLTHLRRKGYRVVRLDEVLPLLRTPGSVQPFVALTFDDGYRDTVTEALPVLERHQAPFTVFATTGFLDRTARLWWIELERALATLSSAEIALGGRRHRLVVRTAREKDKAFAAIRDRLLEGGDSSLLAAMTQLCDAAGVSPSNLVDELCMDWKDLARLVDHPLATIGCHTLTHSRLAKMGPEPMRDELRVSRRQLEDRLGVPVRHVCYPYGWATAAGTREFATAAGLGFATGVTTRPGVLTGAYAAAPTALPRISVNGLWQSVGALDVLLSGLGFALWNRARAPGLSAAAVPPDRAVPST